MASAPQGNDVSVLRVNLLRAVYLVIALGMGLRTWPPIITDSGDWAHAAGTVKCMFGALTLLCLGCWKSLALSGCTPRSASV